MKHNLKLRERLGALLLALLFIVQAVLGLLPACVTQAASLKLLVARFVINNPDIFFVVMFKHINTVN